MVLVMPRMWPDTTDTAPNSPIARALHRITPYSSPHLMLGSVTRQKVCQPEAPSDTAASSSSLPCACISGMSSRAMNGKVTKMVASTMPGTANSSLMSCACNQWPNQPCAPNSSTYTRPDTTGLTANGKSISVMSRLLPLNSNLAMAQDAAMPNSRLAGTAMAAAMKVSLIADQASGSFSAAKYSSQPLLNASMNTVSSGRPR